jgi:methyltransferase-like protein
LLKKEFELLQRMSDSYLIHEHLETHNDPVYFHEFMRRAEEHGLQFLAESELLSMSTHRTGSQAEEILRGFASNIVELEQYMDFLRNRMFRQTLLCHKSVKLQQELDPGALSSMHVACALKPRDPPVNIRDASVKAAFADPNGALETSDPRLKAALVVLSECWPKAIPFDELTMRMNARLYDDPVDAARFRDDSRSVAPSFCECYARGVMRLFLHPPVYVATPSDHPKASPVARLQAEHSPVVTNLLHQMITLNDIGRHVLRLADGTRTEEDLLKALTGLVDKGELLLQADSKPVRNASEARPLLSQSLTRCLKKLCEDALLVG